MRGESRGEKSSEIKAPKRRRMGRECKKERYHPQSRGRPMEDCQRVKKEKEGGRNQSIKKYLLKNAYSYIFDVK